MEQQAALYEFFDNWGIVNALLTLAGFLVFWLSRMDKARSEAKANKADGYLANFIVDQWITFIMTGLLTLFGSPAIHKIQALPELVYLIIGWSGGSIFKYVYDKVMNNLDSIPILKNLKK
jgi:hypothetical protein